MPPMRPIAIAIHFLVLDFSLSQIIPSKEIKTGVIKVKDMALFSGVALNPMVNNIVLKKLMIARHMLCKSNALISLLKLNPACGKKGRIVIKLKTYLKKVIL